MMGEFVFRLENIVDAELDTLRLYIQNNSSSRAKTLELSQFYDHVFLWAYGVWKDRVGDDEEATKSDGPKEGELKIVDTEETQSQKVPPQSNKPAGNERDLAYVNELLSTKITENKEAI